LCGEKILTLTAQSETEVSAYRCRECARIIDAIALDEREEQLERRRTKLRDQARRRRARGKP
jgi:hypothetical protein